MGLTRSKIDSVKYEDMKFGRGRIFYSRDRPDGEAGDIYEGEIKDGVPHGKGQKHIKDRERTYVGEFFNGQFHGKGKYFD